MRILSLFVLMLMFGRAHAATWYIRHDGGTLAQCDGQHDAAYVAGGTKACALNDYRLLAYPGPGGYALQGKFIIAGGDTVHIAAGAFRVGYNGPNANDHDGFASAGNPFAGMPPIPSGTVARPTQIIGAGSGLTQLYGGYGAGSVIDLTTSSNVVIQGIELTDHGQCTRIGAGYAAPVVPCSSSYPLSDYASNGVVTGVATQNVVLQDLNIHGFASRGIIGPIGGTVKLDHVRIAFNGMAGWDFDDGKGTQSDAGAQVNASYLTVEGNGCNEEYPIVRGFPAASCFDQSSGGYGDGVGTPNTPLSFSCDHCLFRYNTQDGLDLLHASKGVIRITNSSSYGNMGQQWKLGAMASVLFENNTWVHNCNRMSAPIQGNSTYNKYLTNFCRAAGDGAALSVVDGGSYIFQNNSYAGYGATTYDISCGGTCTSPNIVFENNLHIGYANPMTGSGGQMPGVFYLEPGVPANPFITNSNNIFYNMRSVPSGGVGTDPHIANEPTWNGEASLDAIDFHLTAQSVNAIGQGASVAGLVTDFSGAARAAKPSIGAYEFASGSAIVVPPPSGAAVGTPSTNYTINITLGCTLNGTVFNCSPR